MIDGPCWCHSKKLYTSGNMRVSKYASYAVRYAARHTVVADSEATDECVTAIDADDCICSHSNVERRL